MTDVVKKGSVLNFAQTGTEMLPWGNCWCDLCDGGAESAPPGWNRVKVSENFAATPVALVAPAVTSLR